MARHDYRRCVLGLAAPDCLMGACCHYEREKGCSYVAPEAPAKLGLTRRTRATAAEPTREPPGEAA